VESLEFESTLARVMKLAGTLPLAAQSGGSDDVEKVFRTKLRTGLTSLDAALAKQKSAMGRLEVNARDEDRFKANNAKMQAAKAELGGRLQNEKKKVKSAKTEAEILEWAAGQLEKLEELTPKSAKRKPKKLEEAVKNTSASSSIMAKLEQLSSRIKSIVDALD
jgi:hypothetical protein